MDNLTCQLITVKCNCGKTSIEVFDTGLKIDREIAKSEASLMCPFCNASLDQKLMVAIDHIAEDAILGMVLNRHPLA